MEEVTKDLLLARTKGTSDLAKALMSGNKRIEEVRR